MTQFGGSSKIIMKFFGEERKVVYNEFEISNEVIEASKKALENVKKQFEYIEEIAEYNQIKVLTAFKKNRLAEAHFFGTSGYGYNDMGREIIEKIYADIFGVEDALVRLEILYLRFLVSLMIL